MYIFHDFFLWILVQPSSIHRRAFLYDHYCNILQELVLTPLNFWSCSFLCTISVLHNCISPGFPPLPLLPCVLPLIHMKPKTVSNTPSILFGDCTQSSMVKWPTSEHMRTSEHGFLFPQVSRLGSYPPLQKHLLRSGYQWLWPQPSTFSPTTRQFYQSPSQRTLWALFALTLFLSPSKRILCSSLLILHWFWRVSVLTILDILACSLEKPFHNISTGTTP